MALLPKTAEALDETLSKMIRLLWIPCMFFAIELGSRALLRSTTKRLQRSASEPSPSSSAAAVSAESTPDTPPPHSTLPAAPPLSAAEHFSDGKAHLLLACTGSVATIKLPQLLQHFAAFPALSVRVVLSESARKFLCGQAAEQPDVSSLASIPNVDGIYVDADEWARPWRRGDAILHIELRRWADLLAVAPLSADGLARMADGRSGDLLGSVMRAWDTRGTIDVARPGVAWPYGGGRRKGIIVAPAMNTAMWSHPVTAKHVAQLEGEWGVARGGWVEVLRPVEKELACGDTGSGAMRDWREIAGVIEERLGLRRGGEAGDEYMDVTAADWKKLG